jgi:hypothetical protein
VMSCLDSCIAKFATNQTIGVKDGVAHVHRDQIRRVVPDKALSFLECNM